MPLDRQDIEKKDFPIGRRGYEPEAVDEHLARVADELDALRRQAQRRGGDSLATSAADQVRAIVEAAESSAATIEREAEEDAQRIREEARADAERRDREAVERSQEHVARVSEQTAQMLQRVEAMESELGALLESVRTGANRLTADLSLLEGSMGELYSAASSGRVSGAGDSYEEPAAPVIAEPPAEVPEAAGAGTAAAGAAASAPGGEGEDDEPERPQLAADAAAQAEQPAVAAEPVAETPPQVTGAVDVDEDVEGARLIALNMALNGQPREETDRYLAENFDLGDRQSLLDEVYQSVGG